MSYYETEAMFMVDETYKYSSIELYAQEHTKSSIYDLKYGGKRSSDVRQEERDRTGAFLVFNMILNSLDLSQDAAVLNIGINDGREMQNLGLSNIVGTDLSRRALKRGLKMFPNLKYVLADVEDLPFQADHFDLVVSLRTLQCSLLNKGKAMKEIKRVIKDKRAVIISSPTGYFSEEETIVRGLMINGQVDPERADREIEEIKRLLIKENFEIIGVFRAPIETFMVAMAEK